MTDRDIQHLESIAFKYHEKGQAVPQEIVRETAPEMRHYLTDGDPPTPLTEDGLVAALTKALGAMQQKPARNRVGQLNVILSAESRALLDERCKSLSMTQAQVISLALDKLA